MTSDHPGGELPEPPASNNGELQLPDPDQWRARRPLRLQYVAVVLWSIVFVVGVRAAIQFAHRNPPTELTSLRQATDGPNSGLAPAFSLPELANTNRRVDLARSRGRPVVLNFWASWCVPCRREMPKVEAAFQQAEGRVVFLGIDYKDDRHDALAFLQRTGIHYPSGSDFDGTLGSKYGLVGVPTTVFINSGGRIVARILGEMRDDTLSTALKGAFELRLLPSPGK